MSNFEVGAAIYAIISLMIAYIYAVGSEEGEDTSWDFFSNFIVGLVLWPGLVVWNSFRRG